LFGFGNVTGNVAWTANLLGFGEQDIQILMAVGKLTPPGDPAPNGLAKKKAGGPCEPPAVKVN
jgi:hypothetical protein